MKTIRLFDYCLFDSDTWQVIAQDGSKLALRSQTTGRVRHVGIAELLGADSFHSEEAVTLPELDNVGILDTLTPAYRDRALELYRHIYEIEHGTPPPGSDPNLPIRPEYSLEEPLGFRVQAKVAELAATSRPLSERTLHRHLAAYRKHGVAGLVDKRGQRTSQPGRRQDPRLLELLEAEIAGQENLSTGTRTRAITRVTIQARELGIHVPSKPTMFSLLREFERQRHPFGNATVRRTQAKRPQRSYGRQSPLRPGEVVEIDSTPLDLMVVFPDGSTGRPELTTMIDVATRTVTAAVLMPEATRGSDLAALVLARSLTPLSMQPGWPEEIALARSVLPAAMIEPDETLHAHVAARPLIYPESITVDRGKNFIGEVFRQACDRLQISLVLASPGTPTDKPHVERQFHDVHRGLIQYLDGYVGPNVVRRGKNPAGDARWTISQVQSLLDQWLLSIWQTKPRKGLTLPAMPKRALSPNEMYAALSGIAPTPAISLAREDYMALMPVAYRSIQPYGINFNGLHYDSPELHEYRGVRSGLPSPANGKWELHYDPARMNTIFVRDHRKGRWIEAEWSLAKKALAPFSEAVLKAALRTVKQRGSNAPAVDILAEILRIQAAPAGLSGTERKAARRHPEPSVPLSPVEPELEREEEDFMPRIPRTPKASSPYEEQLL